MLRRGRPCARLFHLLGRPALPTLPSGPCPALACPAGGSLGPRALGPGSKPALSSPGFFLIKPGPHRQPALFTQQQLRKGTVSFGPGGRGALCPLLGSGLRIHRPGTLDPLPQEGTWQCRAGISLPLPRCRLREAGAPGRRAGGQQGRGGWVLSPLSSRPPLPAPVGQRVHLQMPLLMTQCVCQPKTPVFGRRRGHFLGKMLLHHMPLGPRGPGQGGRGGQRVPDLWPAPEPPCTSAAGLAGSRGLFEFPVADGTPYP